MILLKMFLLQGMVAVIVVIVLWILLEKELIVIAIERLLQLDPGEARDEREVTVLSASKIPADLQARLGAVIKDKFPKAQMNVIVNREILGGIVIQAGKVLVDSSLANKWKQMWGGQAG